MDKRSAGSRAGVAVAGAVGIYLAGYAVLWVDLRYFDSALLRSLPEAASEALRWIYWPVLVAIGFLESLFPSRI